MKSRASEFVETRPIDYAYIARWWSIAMCAPATLGLLKISYMVRNHQDGYLNLHFIYFLKISGNLNLFGKIDWSMNSQQQRAGDY